MCREVEHDAVRVAVLERDSFDPGASGPRRCLTASTVRADVVVLRDHVARRQPVAPCSAAPIRSANSSQRLVDPHVRRRHAGEGEHARVNGHREVDQARHVAPLPPAERRGRRSGDASPPRPPRDPCARSRRGSARGCAAISSRSIPVRSVVIIVRPSMRSDLQTSPRIELPRRIDDRLVEGDVRAHLLVASPLRRGLLHRSEVALQLPTSPSSSIGRLTRRDLLDRGPDREDLEQLPPPRPRGRARRGTARTPRTPALEVAQRLPHRRLARPELLREPRLDEALAGRVLAAQDARQISVLDLLPQQEARGLRSTAAACSRISTTPVAPLTRTRSPVLIRSRRGRRCRRRPGARTRGPRRPDARRRRRRR